MNIESKEKITLEFPLNTSGKILFPRLSTPHGLQEWFADEVTSKGNVFSFDWKQSREEAEMLHLRPNKEIAFRWLSTSDDSYFQFNIEARELTGDISLFITDFVEFGEVDEITDLWTSQINILKRGLGI